MIDPDSLWSATRTAWNGVPILPRLLRAKTYEDFYDVLRAVELEDPEPKSFTRERILEAIDLARSPEIQETAPTPEAVRSLARAISAFEQILERPILYQRFTFPEICAIVGALAGSTGGSILGEHRSIEDMVCITELSQAPLIIHCAIFNLSEVRHKYSLLTISFFDDCAIDSEFFSREAKKTLGNGGVMSAREIVMLSQWYKTESEINPRGDAVRAVLQKLKESRSGQEKALKRQRVDAMNLSPARSSGLGPSGPSGPTPGDSSANGGPNSVSNAAQSANAPGSQNSPPSSGATGSSAPEPLPRIDFNSVNIDALYAAFTADEI